MTLRSLNIVMAFLLLVTRAAAAENDTPTAAKTDLFDRSLAELAKIPIVYGASKWEQPITKAPSSVTIITADDVKKYGYRTLADILQGARGLYVGNDRNYSQLGIRGVLGDLNNQVLLLVDGHRLNNNLTDGAYIGTEGILDVDLIDRVEIIRGPGSTLYGNNAFFGVVNVITRLPGDFTGRGAEVSVEAGSFDTYKGRATFGHIFKNGLEMLLSGSWYDSQGRDRLFYKEYNTLRNNFGIAEKADDDAYKSVFGNLSYRDFTLQGAYITREKGDPTARYLTAFDDPRNRRTDERSYVNLKYAHEFPDIGDVTARVYFDSWDLALDEFYNDPPPSQFLRENQSGKWWGAELQFKKEFFEKHTLSAGVEYKDDFKQHRHLFDHAPGTNNYADDQRTRQNYSVYLQGEVAVVTNLHVNAGARYDHYSTVGGSANPRAAIIYNPAQKSTFKAIFGTAFRAPNFFELAGRSPSMELKPETVTSYELVYEQEIGSHFRSSLSGFFNRMNDLITFRPDPTSTPTNQISSFQNAEGADAKGLEFEIEAFGTSGLRGRVSYTFQETEDRLTSQILPDSPRHLGKLNLSAPLYKDKLFADLEFQCTSRRLTLNGTGASGFGIVNFTLFSQNLVKGLDISASIYNLLDRTYSDPATSFHLQDLIERDGRSFRVKLTYRF